MPNLIYFQSPECPTGVNHLLEQLNAPHSVATIPEHLTIPEACLHITQMLNIESVVIVAAGSRCLDLPTFSRAQSAAHRPIIGYSLISPIFPTSTDQWPQAPVTVYLPHSEEPERLVSLRGYQIVHFLDPAELARRIIDQSLLAQ
jgi:hypothetical protein